MLRDMRRNTTENAHCAKGVSARGSAFGEGGVRRISAFVDTLPGRPKSPRKRFEGTIEMSEAGKLRERPMSPHLSVWRWHITMATSILHRATGVALYIGALIAAGWAISLAKGPESYAWYKGLLGTPLGLIVMFGLTVSFFYHLANGIRHLVWDAGHGLDLKSANASAAFVIAFAAVASLAVWAVYLNGAL
jgi:succinate dehydrogenase / fumarate reductase cytochrome b subunit